jgi:hypothetical protein
MRIHSDTLTAEHFEAARQFASAQTDLGTVYLGECQLRASRTRRYAFEVKLEGDGSKRRRNNHSNTGFAASYDQWGWFLAYLFSIDADAKAGPYDGVTDFDEQTGSQFTSWTIAA